MENSDEKVTDAGSAGSTLFSIDEHELRNCPNTPEHQSICLSFISKRLDNLGFQLPSSFKGPRQLSCKAFMITYETDVLFVLKSLVDDYERVREERDDLRTSDKIQRHEFGRLSRRSESLERRLLAKDKKLADAEYRLAEQRNQADELRATIKREVQNTRLAKSGMARLIDQVQHQERRTQRQLLEATQRVGQTLNHRLPIDTLDTRGRRRRMVSEKLRLSTHVKPKASHHVMSSDLFDTIDLCLPGQLPGCRRNRSVPSRIWYKVPAVKAAPDLNQAGRHSKYPDQRAKSRDPSVMSMGETIDASGMSWHQRNRENSAISVLSVSSLTIEDTCGGGSRPYLATELNGAQQ